MKKYLKYIDVIALGASAVGVILRFWFLRVGVDEKNLFPAGHISWILLILVSIVLAAALFLLAGSAGKNRFYVSNFPASIPGAAGYAVGAVGLILAALRNIDTHGIRLYQISGYVGILAAAALLWGGWCRFKGKRPHFAVFAVPCAYFCMRLFCMGHLWGDEPEYCRFIFAFLATAGCILSCYQLWAFSVNLGNRATGLFTSLFTFYLCIVSVPGSADAPAYLAMALWLFTNLYPIQTPALPTASLPAEQEIPAAEPEAPAAEEAAQPKEEIDPVSSEVESIIADILRKTSQEKE